MPPLSEYETEKLAKLKRLRELQAQEEKRAAEHYAGMDVFRALGYTPTAKQLVFHAATEFDVLYGGAAGGGKSRALVMDAIWKCVKYPGLKVGLFRRTYGELRGSLIKELAATGFCRVLGAKWNGSEWTLKFPNGSAMEFGYARNLADATVRQGAEYQAMYFDERTLTPPDVISFLESRLRSGNADIPVLGIRSGTNPGGPSHGAVKDRFIVPTNYGKNIVEDDFGRTVRFIPSKLSDNPHVNAEYRQLLMALPEQMRTAFLNGDWDSFLGQAFATWEHEMHVVEPMPLAPTWRRYNGLDWGYTAPWCVLWGAVDEDGRVWIYREAYGKKLGEAEQARRILAAEERTDPNAPPETVLGRYADDAMWATRGDAKSLADAYAEAGVYLTRAGKGGRVTGWQRVRSYLEMMPACPHHRAQGYEECPRLHVFSSAANLIRTLPTLPAATKGDPEDIDTRAEDHAADALRYLLLNIGVGPQFPDDDIPEVPEAGVVTGHTYTAVHQGSLPPEWYRDYDEIQRTNGVRTIE